MTLISRVGFCEECFRKQQPREGTYYCVVGDKNFYVLISNHISSARLGFTPHFYNLVKVIGQNVIYEKSCGIHNCGGHVTMKDDKATWTFDKKERCVVTIEQWNAMVRYKDESYHLSINNNEKK
jgi:hypothetical protein